MTIGGRQYSGGAIGDGGMYGYTNARMGNAMVRDCQVNSSLQPQYWGREGKIRRYFGPPDLEGDTWQTLDSKVISQNHMKINLAVESKALDEEAIKLRTQGGDKTSNEFATPAMSAFKNTTYNPMRAPVMISEERLSFLQGLTPPPDGIRNNWLEATLKQRKEAKERKKRIKKFSSGDDKKSTRSNGSKASSVLTEILDQQADMHSSLQEMRGRLSVTHKQLEALNADKLHPRAVPEKAWGHPYTTFNSARKHRPHPLDPLPSERAKSEGAGSIRSKSSLGSETRRSALSTARSGASLVTGNTAISGYSQMSGFSKATSADRFPAAYGLYT